RDITLPLRTALRRHYGLLAARSARQARRCLLPVVPTRQPRSGRGPCSPGPFPDDLGGGLVVAQPEKARLPQPAVTRPLGEPDLDDQLGASPVRAPRDWARID